MFTCTSDWMERPAFPAANNRCHDGRKSHERLGCGPDQSQDGYFKLYLSRFSYLGAGTFLLQFCAENLSWDIRLVLWRKFNFFCGIAVSCICIMQTAAFSCYGFSFYNICMPGVSCNWGRHNATWLCESVILAFISLWKLKFLAYLLNVTQCFLMHIISYANVVYFIFI